MPFIPASRNFPRHPYYEGRWNNKLPRWAECKMFFAAGAPFNPAMPGAFLPALGFITYREDFANLTSYTSLAVPLGPVEADREIICVVNGAAGADRSLVSATIAGIPAAIDVQTDPGAAVAAIIRAPVPTGATGDIVVTFSGPMLAAGIGVYWLHNELVTTPVDVGQLNVTADGMTTLGGLSYDLNSLVIFGYSHLSAVSVYAATNYGAVQNHYNNSPEAGARFYSMSMAISLGIANDASISAIATTGAVNRAHVAAVYR